MAENLVSFQSTADLEALLMALNLGMLRAASDAQVLASMEHGSASEKQHALAWRLNRLLDVVASELAVREEV